MWSQQLEDVLGVVRERDREFGWSGEYALLQGFQSRVGGVKHSHHNLGSPRHPSPLELQGFAFLSGQWGTALTS